MAIIKVKTGGITADAVTATEIADNAVVTAAINADAITSAKIADNAVVTAAINADAVTDAKIADDVVGTEHLTANEVDTAALGADAVTGAQLADNAVNSEHYTDGSIDTAHIADAQITAAKLASGVGGKLLQAVTASISTAKTISSSSFATTDLTVNITPSASSSKIFVIASGSFDTGAADRLGFMTIYRDSTNIGGSGSSGIAGNYASGSTRLNTPFGIHVLDSPNSTSQIAYAVYCRGNNSGGITFLEESETAHITVMEIGA